MSGWIKLHRALLDHPRKPDPDWLAVWVHLLLSATHAHRRTIFNGQQIELKPGQLITGRYALAKQTGVNASKIWRVLEMLKSEQQIEQQGGNKSSLITITNWAKYQETEQQNEQPVSSKRAADEQQVSTLQECKNERMEEGRCETARVRGEAEPTVEPLPSFPLTEDAAKAAAATVGCPEEFTVKTWNAAMGRGGRDSKDVLIRSFVHHLSAAWKYDKERQARKAPTGSPEAPAAPGAGPTLLMQLKAAQALLEDVNRRLATIPLPNRHLYPGEYDEAVKKRAPLVNDKAELVAKIRELNQRIAGQ